MAEINDEINVIMLSGGGDRSQQVMPGQAAIMPPGAGGMSPSTVTVPSPVSGLDGGMTSSHPHQSGIGIKPGGGHSSSPNVLQVVEQVQEEAARQQDSLGDGFGKGVTMPLPLMQRPLNVPNQGNIGGMVGNVGLEVGVGVGGVNQMIGGVPGSNVGGGVMGNNLLPMDQWSSGDGAQQRYNVPPQQTRQLMQQNPMQQQQMGMGMGGVAGPGPNQMGGEPGNMPGVVGGGVGMAGGAPHGMGDRMGANTAGVRPPGAQSVIAGGTGAGPNLPTGLPLNTQQLDQIIQKIKNDPSNKSNQHILSILKQNPQIMVAIIKQREQREQAMQQHQQQQPGPYQRMPNMQNATMLLQSLPPGVTTQGNMVHEDIENTLSALKLEEDT